MIGIESIKYSLRNLVARKSRSFFTILSIFVGITTIFLFISFGLGLLGYIDELSTGSTVNKILVQAKGSGAPGIDDTFKLLDEDVEVIEKTKGVLLATGSKFIAADIKQDDITKYAFLISYDPKIPLMMEFSDIGIEKGRWLKDDDDGKVLLGYNYMLPDKIMPKPYDVGDKIEILGQKLRIVGFVETVGNPTDDANIYVTNEFIDEMKPDEELSYGMIVAEADIKEIDAVSERIEKNLRDHRNQEEGKEDFFVASFQDLLDAYSGALNIVVGFIVLIALISVLVSAVNTANTMVTSVIERIKEIGVIKSIGARNSEIFGIFLFESAFLGFVSGILGVFIGWLLASAGGAMMNNLGWGFLAPDFSFTLFAGLILFATLTGAISGVVPAYQASKLKPVDALRFE